MMRKLILLLPFVCGCATLDNIRNHPREIPMAWKDKGLVIGQFANSTAIGFPSLDYMEVVVDSHTPSGGIFQSVIMFTKQPGEYTLSEVFRSSPAGGYGAVTMKQTTSIPLKRNFSTKADEITVLGLMYFMPDAKDAKKFRTITFDNTNETMVYMKKYYPDLLKGRESAPVNKAPGNYFGPERLEALRQDLAKRQALLNKRQGQFFVASLAGTLAEVRVKGSDVTVLRLLPPATYADVNINQYDDDGNLTFRGFDKAYKVVNGQVQEIINVKK